MMRVLDMIARKRDGGTLDAAAIGALVDGYTQDAIPDYQMAAFLMAVYWRGMNGEETAALTAAMAASGKRMDLSGVSGVKVDKHSTGGVADTTTLIVSPLVAAAGVPVAKMSGRGLGFTGGTIDKLAAIPGFSTSLSDAAFIAQLNGCRLAVIGQTRELAPADGKIYALRDVTATVESIPLIASSIMSKKIAAGADKILLDVKVGGGAFMRTKEDALRLARTMVDIGAAMGRETRAVLTGMDEPLGQAVGNSLEIEEAVEVLSGARRPALLEVCLTLGAHMLTMAGAAPTLAAGRARLKELLDAGAGLAKLRQWIAAQGGDPAVTDDFSLLPQAAYQETADCAADGYIGRFDAARIGAAATALGAGRAYKGQAVDLAAGVKMRRRVGDAVRKGEPLAVLYGNDRVKMAEARRMFLDAVQITPRPPQCPPLVYGVVDHGGFHAADESETN